MKTIFAICLLAAGIAAGQQRGRIPSVTQLIENHDKDDDGKISKQESEGSAQAKRQFDRWDENRDGFATREEITALRRKFGIDAEGNRKDEGKPATTTPAKLTIPSIDEIIGDPALQPFEKMAPIATGRDEKQDSR